MPVTQERLHSTLVEPVFEDGKLKSLKASTFFVVQSQASWESKRDFIADKAVVERAAELSFGRKMVYGLSEAYHQMDVRTTLEKRARGKKIKESKIKSPAMQRAVSAIDELIAGEDAEAEFLAAVVNVRGASRRDTIHELSETKVPTKQNELVLRANKLVENYAKGAIDISVVRDEAKVIADELKKHMSQLSKSKIGTDLVAVAEAVRAAYSAHQEKLESVDFSLSVKVGSADGGLQTKSKRDLIDWLVDVSQSNRYLSKVIHPLTVGVAAGVGAWALRAPARYVPVIGGLAGGVFAGLRRFSKEKKDRYLKMREAEIGYENSSMREPSGKREKVLAWALGRTDFNEYSYDLMDACEACEKLTEYVDRGDVNLAEDASDSAKVAAGGRRNSIIDLAVEVQARIDIADELGKATIKYGKDGSGLFNINKERFELVAAVRMAWTQLEKHVGKEELERTERRLYWDKRRKIISEIENTDARFDYHRLKQAARSGGVAVFTGLIGGFGIHLAGEMGERVGEKAADLAGDVRKRVTTHVGNLEIKEVIGAKNVDVNIPQDYKAQVTNDGSNIRLTSVDGKDFDVPFAAAGMSQREVEQSLRDAGFEAKVGISTQILKDPDRTLVTGVDVLDSGFLKDHNLVEVNGRDFDLSFARGRELTLHQDSTANWSVAPLSGVNQENLVAFYQTKDMQGNWHTVLADTTNGRFTIPAEFIDHETGKIDQVEVIGYGTAYDASGHVLAADKLIARPDLMKDGRLESMASVAFDQHTRPLVVTVIPGAERTLTTIKIDDLTKVDYVDAEHDFDINFPGVAIPFAPRVFPSVPVDQYPMRNNQGSRTPSQDFDYRQDERISDDDSEPVAMLSAPTAVLERTETEIEREDGLIIEEIEEELGRIIASGERRTIAEVGVVQTAEEEVEGIARSSGLRKHTRAINLNNIARKAAKRRQEETGVAQRVARSAYGKVFNPFGLFARETEEETEDYLRNRGLSPKSTDIRWLGFGPKKKTKRDDEGEDEEDELTPLQIIHRRRKRIAKELGRRE